MRYKFSKIDSKVLGDAARKEKKLNKKIQKSQSRCMKRRNLSKYLHWVLFGQRHLTGINSFIHQKVS